MPGWVWTLQQRGHIVVELGGISYWESSKLLPCHTTRDRHDDDDKEYLSQKRERFKIRLHVCFEFQWVTITIVSYVFYECSAMKKISGPEKLELRASYRFIFRHNFRSTILRLSTESQSISISSYAILCKIAKQYAHCWKIMNEVFIKGFLSSTFWQSLA